MEATRDNSVVPDSVTEVSSKKKKDSVTEVAIKTSQSVQQFQAEFLQFLSLCDPEVLADLTPLQRAQSLLLLAQATTNLYTLRLRCSGVHPDKHPVKSEHERLRLYEQKLERFIALDKAPLRPSTTINYKAATRFIEHSLPDLTPEQRKSMKAISKGESTRIKYSERSVLKKRRCNSPPKQSARAAAQEFLEKAARELLGDKKDGLKGPLQHQDVLSDENCQSD